MKKFTILRLIILLAAGTTGCAKQNPMAPAVESVVVAPPAPTFNSWNTGLNNPMGIAADSTGNLYVADAGADKIIKFDNSGTLLSEWGRSGLNDASANFFQIFGLAVDSSNNVYVADAGFSLILKYNSDGVLQNQWGEKGTGDGQLNYPFGVAVDKAGTIYAADSFNGRIQKLVRGQNSFTQVTPLVSPVQKPVGITLDNQGNIFTTDYDANVLVKYNEVSGASVTIGGPGSGPGQFSNPTHVLLDANGNIFVVDYNNSRVQMLSASGTFVKEWGTSGPSDWRLKYPVGAVLSGGYLYVTDSGNHRVVKYSL